jgi:hypothetical protein
MNDNIILVGGIFIVIGLAIIAYLNYQDKKEKLKHNH